MKVLVIGGTGTVGSLVVSELLARKTEVSVLTRDAGKAKQLPAGVQAVTGNLQSPATVRSVFEGIDGVFMLNAVSATETNEGLMAVNGMRQAGIERLVYMSVHNLEQAPHLPHFGSKIPVEMAIKASGIPYTILRPNNFYQNDYWYQEVIVKHQVYPQPLGQIGLSRVDVRDIAEAAAIALTTSEHEGEIYNLVGPEVLNGPRTASLWSEALGKEITYGGDDLDEWEKQSLAYLPDWMVYDFKLMYAFFQDKGLKALPEDIKRQTDLLGHAPRDFAAFARETAQKWQGQN